MVEIYSARRPCFFFVILSCSTGGAGGTGTIAAWRGLAGAVVGIDVSCVGDYMKCDT